MPLEDFLQTFLQRVADVEGHSQMAPAAHLAQWCAAWKDHRFVAVIAARGFLKSMFAKAIIAYSLYTHSEGAADVFFFSAKRELAQEHLRRLKMYLAPLAQEWGWHDMTEGETTLRFASEGRYWSCQPEGVDSAARGRRADLIVCDDVLDARKPSTYVDIQRVMASVQRRIVPLMKAGKARIFFAGTPIIEDDVVAWVQANREFYTVRMPAIVRPDGENEFLPGTPLDIVFTHGVPTWPQRYPMTELVTFRHLLGDKFFGAEFMLWPIGPTGSFIPMEILERAIQGESIGEGEMVVDL